MIWRVEWSREKQTDLGLHSIIEWSGHFVGDKRHFYLSDEGGEQLGVLMDSTGNARRVSEKGYKVGCGVEGL